MTADHSERQLVVRGTELRATDESRVCRQKLARITLDSMVQFVGLLDAQGTVLETTRILVVDDNEDGAEMLAEVLGVQGYETRIAHDAPAALAAAASFAPDIAFLDIGLPVMDGYELASHLRALPGLAGIRLVALTGYGQADDLDRSAAAGFHQHLVKPVDMDAIAAALKSLVTGAIRPR